MALTKDQLALFKDGVRDLLQCAVKFGDVQKLMTQEGNTASPEAILLGMLQRDVDQAYLRAKTVLTDNWGMKGNLD